MDTCYLDNIRFSSIQMSINLPKTESIDIKVTYRFNVDFAETSLCIADLQYDINSTDEGKSLHISVEAIGQIQCRAPKEDSEKKLIHKRAYEMMFPYAQATISEIFLKAGLPPLMLKMDNIDPEKVNMG